MSGCGVMKWRNGDRFFGEYKNNKVPNIPTPFNAEQQWGSGFKIFEKSGDFMAGEWYDDAQDGSGFYIFNSDFQYAPPHSELCVSINM